MDTQSVNAWTRKAYPERLHARLEEAIEYLDRHPEVQSSDWLFQTAQRFMAPASVLISALDEFIDLPVDVIVDEIVALVLVLFTSNSTNEGHGFIFQIPDSFIQERALWEKDNDTQLSVYIYDNSIKMLRQMTRYH